MSKVLIVLVMLMTFGSADVVAGPPQNNTSLVRVYYFHKTVRCPSCSLLEELTRDAVEIGFARELDNGKVTMQAINVDEKANEHFVDDYHLNVQSIVLSQVEHGKEIRWKNLDQIWRLFEDKELLWEYLQEEIQKFIIGPKKQPERIP
jgi:hypothetical protein